MNNIIIKFFLKKNKNFFINKMYDKNLFEIVYDDHKEVYDLDSLNCYLIYMSFDQLISNLNNIDLNDNNEIILINKDKTLFSIDWFSKYNTYKYNNMCLILYKQEPDYIKVAEIEFINVEFSDNELIFKEINFLKKENNYLKNKINEINEINNNEIIFLKKENELFKNKIIDLDNLNQLNIDKNSISKELLSYFSHKKFLIKIYIDNYNKSINNANDSSNMKNPNRKEIKILHEDDIYLYTTINIDLQYGVVDFSILNENSDFYSDKSNLICKELYIYEKIDYYVGFRFIPPRNINLYDNRLLILYNEIEIIFLGSNKYYDIGKNANDKFVEVSINKNVKLNELYKYDNFYKTGKLNIIEFLNKFKKLKKIILYDCEINTLFLDGRFVNDHFFYKVNDEYINLLKENFGDILEIKSWNKN